MPLQIAYRPIEQCQYMLLVFVPAKSSVCSLLKGSRVLRIKELWREMIIWRISCGGGTV